MFNKCKQFLYITEDGETRREVFELDNYDYSVSLIDVNVFGGAESDIFSDRSG